MDCGWTVDKAVDNFRILAGEKDFHRLSTALSTGKSIWSMGKIPSEKVIHKLSTGHTPINAAARAGDPMIRYEP